MVVEIKNRMLFFVDIIFWAVVTAIFGELTGLALGRGKKKG